MQIKTTLRCHIIPVRMGKIKKTNDRLFCRGCELRGTLIHCLYDYKLVQPLWKSVLQFLRKLGINQPQDWKIPPTFGHIPKRCSIILQRHLFNYVHSSIICVIARTWEETRCPSTEKWKRKCDTFTHWSSTQQGKRWHIEICMQMYGTRNKSILSEVTQTQRMNMAVLTHKRILAVK